MLMSAGKLKMIFRTISEHFTCPSLIDVRTQGIRNLLSQQSNVYSEPNGFLPRGKCSTDWKDETHYLILWQINNTLKI